MDCWCSNNSVVVLGRNIYINSYSSYILVLATTERENIIIGRDCLLSYGICMRTADLHIVYDCNTKKRINYSKSILNGDHVWIGQSALILKGSRIGSGAIREEIHAKCLEKLCFLQENMFTIICKKIHLGQWCAIVMSTYIKK